MAFKSPNPDVVVLGPVGTRLIGVVVVGVGLPQLGLERDLIKDHFAQRNKEGDALSDPAEPEVVVDQRRGFAYAYQYPGMNRVLQTSGRVIRDEDDRGVVILVDDRFVWQDYRRLFPAHWRPAII